MITLLHGPAGSGKSDILFREMARDHLQKPLLRSFRLIVPHLLAVEATQKKLQKISGTKGLFFLESVGTVGQLLTSLLKKSLPRVHPISSMTTRNLLRRLLAEKSYPSLERAKKFPGLTRKLGNTFARLKKNSVEPVKLRHLFERHSSAEITDFLNLFDDYQALCAQFSFFDSGELTTSALYLLRKGRLAWPEEITHLYLDRLFPISLGERLFLKELSQHHPEIDIRVSLSFDYQDRDDPFFYPAFSFLGEIAQASEAFSFTKEVAPLTLHYSTNPASEIETIADSIELALTEGTSPEDISVILPPDEFYHERIHRALSSRGIPCHPPHQPKLEAYAPPPGSVEGIIPMIGEQKGDAVERLLSASKARELFEEEWAFEKSLLFPSFSDSETLARWQKEEEREVRIPGRTDSGGVRLGTLKDLYWADSDHLFISGFSSRFYPSLSEEHPFFTPEMLSDAGLREILGGSVYQWELERRHLQQAIGRCRQSVLLSVPKILWSGEEQFVSRLLDPLTLSTPAQTSRHPDFPTSRLPNIQTSRHPDIPTSRLPDIQTSRHPDIPTSRHPDILFPRWHQPQFSLSELATCQKCPYQYYARHHLKIRPPEDEGIEIPPDKAGFFVHDILMKLYRDNLDLYREAIEYDLYLKRLFEALSQLVSEGKKGDDVWKKLPAPIVDGFGERVVLTIRQLMTGEIAMIRSGVKKTVPRHFEWAFGGKGSPPLRIRGDGSEVAIAGRIDRIDINEDKKIFSVIDYKTGGLDAIAAIKEGNSLQLPVYLMAVSDLLLKGYRPASGLLIGMKEGVKWSGIVFDGAGEDELLKKISRIGATDWEGLRSEIGRKIGGLAKTIREAHFSPNPLSTQECRVCDFRTLCHYEEKECL